MKQIEQQPLFHWQRMIFLVAVLASFLTVGARNTFAQDDATAFHRPRNPGFRTDVGIHFSAGSQQCLAGSAAHGACQDFGVDWSPSFGMALGLIIRPGTYISLGLDAALMTMGGQDRASDSWLELMVGPTGRLHLPIRFGRIVLEPAVGLTVGYSEGHLRFRNENDTRFEGALLGPFIGILCNLQLFILPGFGVGLDLRIHKMFYREVCVRSKDTHICRGVEDKRSQYYSEMRVHESHNVLEGLRETTFSWKIYTGGHLVYYF